MGKFEQKYASSVVPISQYEDEFIELLRIYSELDPGAVLEIGTHYGGTLYHWLQRASRYSTVVAVDNYHINRDLYESWTPPEVRLEVVLGDSRRPETLSEYLKHGPYDFIFIDGGHELATVTNDWVNAQIAAAEGAIIAFHDILPHPNSEVCQLWNWIKSTNLFETKELISDPNQLGCGIGVVYV